ncbi:MAG: glycosyltransferase [Opitutales bacterium]
MATLTIHATNVTGLGASQVVVSFLEALDKANTTFSEILCYVPESGPVAEFKPGSDFFHVFPYKRLGPKAISRALECLFPGLFFKSSDLLIVLGDVPLRVRTQQIVLVHQPHLHSPRVNPWVGRSLTYRLMRGLTRLNAKFASQVIAQTNAMAEGLKESYENWRQRDCLTVIGQPPPSWFRTDGRQERLIGDADGLRLFYPAADYPHKNHQIFEGLLRLDVSGLVERITLTVPDGRIAHSSKWLYCVGRLNHEQCLEAYQSADALVFPSVLESYGLPLVEAMVMGLPILASDLPYARALCGGVAIYFDPKSPENLLAACTELKQRLGDGWKPDWSAQLQKMPPNWSEVVSAFLRLADSK